jgi:hypothetical protein
MAGTRQHKIDLIYKGSLLKGGGAWLSLRDDKISKEIEHSIPTLPKLLN